MCKSVKETYSELLVRISARFPFPFAAQLFIILVSFFLIDATVIFHSIYV